MSSFKRWEVLHSKRCAVLRYYIYLLISRIDVVGAVNVYGNYRSQIASHVFIRLGPCQRYSTVDLEHSKCRPVSFERYGPASTFCRFPQTPIESVVFILILPQRINP
jgi:hypothetical protein